MDRDEQAPQPSAEHVGGGWLQVGSLFEADGINGFVDATRCGGTLWAKIDRYDWLRFHSGHVVQYPRDSFWAVAPTGTYVAVQAGSIEQLICTCAATGKKDRVLRLLTDPQLDRHDVHPAARADAAIWLDDRTALAEVLLASASARAYVCDLNNAGIENLDLAEWAQDFCLTIDAQFAARQAAKLASDEARRDAEMSEWFSKVRLSCSIM
ncbi:hypothetical protein [Pseudorhodoferax sp. Leaf265]|uniref:hypothetical protein n=1 Tax=Pseudorhodoferax sp. Leaf265 TaxID=1736315 RepID=UPI0007013D55|nr:hypothetical protein [Pseudorhodoferax sp. Leaf265]KQP16222.1 hypothetical protein ASF45_06690 [Pseudorhodoferax sp. Leaf265]